MPRKRYSKGQIIPMLLLRRAEVELGQGKGFFEFCKLLEIAQQTYYRWHQKYGGMQPEMSKELTTLQEENTLLKRLVADQTWQHAFIALVRTIDAVYFSPLLVPGAFTTAIQLN